MKSECTISLGLRGSKIALLGLLMLAGGAWPVSGASTNDNNTLRLTVELRDGSRVVGRDADKTLAFHSVLLGNLDLAVKDIRSIECLATNTAKLTTTSGDVLTGGFAKSELNLQTGFGKVGLPVASIRRLTISATRTSGKPIDGLVALWSAEGNANDSVGNRHGQLQNQADYAPGKVGQAFAFHSPDDGMTASAMDFPIGTSDRTLDCWIYLDAFSPGILGFIAGYGDAGAGRLYCLGVATDHRIAFTQWGEAVFGPTLVPGRWYNIAVTSVGTDSIKLYVDGTQVASGSMNFATPPEGRFWIGKYNTPGEERQFIGKIDEVAVYNRALTDDEIKAIYDEAAPAKLAAMGE